MAKNGVAGGGAEIINYDNLRDKIYEIRGRKVMLDVELAKIYGYSTKAFNQQVKNNRAKFEGEDFMFRLTREEVMGLVRSKILTSRESGVFEGQSGGTRYLPYAFTEQGVYMLMTVLRGELATRQSRSLMMAFKAMKDYIFETNGILEQKGQLQLMVQLARSNDKTMDLENKIEEMDGRVAAIVKDLGDMVKRSEIIDVLREFGVELRPHGFLIMDGQPAKASETYIDIYAEAKKNIVIIDNYIDIKTLRHLQKIKDGVEVTVLSDNLGHYLTKNDYSDFAREFPGVKIDFIQTCQRIHDRFIILDFDTDDECIYHCGASSKDAGRRITVINRIQDSEIGDALQAVVKEMLNSSKLEF